VEFLSRVTINLTDFSVEVRNELALALMEVDPPNKIALIRECRICNGVFWAGRADKVACDRHAGQWRKSEQRRKGKAEAKKQAAERKDAQLKKALRGMSRTAVALLNAIVFGKQRVFYKIDHAAWDELDDNPSVLRVPNRRIVRRTLTMLVDRKYLTHQPQDDPLDDLYFPEQHLIKAWTEMHQKQ